MGVGCFISYSGLLHAILETCYRLLALMNSINYPSMFLLPSWPSGQFRNSGCLHGSATYREVGHGALSTYESGSGYDCYLAASRTCLSAVICHPPPLEKRGLIRISFLHPCLFYSGLSLLPEVVIRPLSEIPEMHAHFSDPLSYLIPFSGWLCDP